MLYHIKLIDRTKNCYFWTSVHSIFDNILDSNLSHVTPIINKNK